MTAQRREGDSGDSVAAPHWPIDRPHEQTAAAAATAAKARPAGDCAEAAGDGATNAAVTSGAGAGVSCERERAQKSRRRRMSGLRQAASGNDFERCPAARCWLLSDSRRQQRPGSSARATRSSAAEGTSAQRLQSKEWAAMGAVWARRQRAARRRPVPLSVCIGRRTSRISPRASPPVPSPASNAVCWRRTGERCCRWVRRVGMRQRAETQKGRAKSQIQIERQKSEKQNGRPLD